jgi:hypothetical protein
MATKAVARTNVGEGGSSGLGRGVDPNPPQWGVGAEKGGRRGQVKEHVPPCVVLVINDNPYGLMFALSYICRTCP